MRGHGLIVTGETVPWATYAALTLERVLQIQSIARSLGNLLPMTAEMADRVYPEKYRDDHLAKYWDYLVRQVRRAGLAAGMPGSGDDRCLTGSPSTSRKASRRHRRCWPRFGPDAAIYAGGTELLIVMKERLAHFPHLIDIKRIPGLNEIAFDAERRELSIGAVATHRDLERSPVVRERFPALGELEAAVANIRVRNAGTIGGNLCFAEPHSDPATLLTALDAQLTLTSASGTRQLPMASFITGLMETARRHEEILVDHHGAGAGVQCRRRLRTLQAPRATDRRGRRRDLGRRRRDHRCPGRGWQRRRAPATAPGDRGHPARTARRGGVGDHRRRRHPG